MFWVRRSLYNVKAWLDSRGVDYHILPAGNIGLKAAGIGVGAFGDERHLIVSLKSEVGAPALLISVTPELLRELGLLLDWKPNGSASAEADKQTNP